jgi:hypothetical protein
MLSAQITRRRLAMLLAALGPALAFAQAAPAPQDVTLTPAVRVVFAGLEEGRRLAATPDDYSRRTSAIERQLKVRTTRELSESDYLAELAADVRAWSDHERARVTRALESLREPLARLPLPLPPRVVLVRMSGRVTGEEVAYTRGNEIYLPVDMVSPESPVAALRGLLAHELFHVASRQDRAWRETMYAVVGFRPLPDVVLPSALQARRITNPDAPRLDSAIRVTVAERGPVWVMPLLQSSIERIGSEIPPSFFTVMTLRWLEVGHGDAPPAQATLADPPVLHDTRALQGFYDTIGRNTGYIIHAEEILASNFAQMVTGVPAQSPEIQARMRGVMSGRAARGN